MRAGNNKGRKAPKALLIALLATAVLALILIISKPCPIHPLTAFCADTEKALSAGNGTYLACGCGCCLDPDYSPKAQCVTAKELRRIILEDRGQASSPVCAMAGCSRGALYKVC